MLVDRPDVRGREAILKVHVSKVKLDPAVDLKEVAKITPGLVGADLANLVNEAALLAARANKTTVTMDEFNEGVERVIAGLEKRQRVMHADEKQRVAYHESGHALLAYSLPNTDPVHKVSIIPRGLGTLGYTMHRPEGDRFLQTQSELESKIQVLLAGTVAEEMIYNDISTGAERPGTGNGNRPQHGHGLRHEPVGTDHLSGEPPFAVFDGGGRYFPRPQPQRTNRPGNRRGNPQNRQPVAGKSPPRAGDQRRALVAMADRLIEKETIDTAELKELVESNSPSPMIVPGTTVAPKRRAPKSRRCPRPRPIRKCSLSIY